MRFGFGPDGRSSRVEWGDDDALEIERAEDGCITRAARGETEVVFERDDAGRPLTETGPLGTVTCEYDDEGQLVLLTLPNDEMVVYDYDEDGRLTRVVDWEGRENRFLYAYDGTLQTLQFGNGLAEARSYADPGRLAESRIVAPDGGILTRQTYHYDACERLTDILDTWEGAPGSPWKRQLVYDDEDRILAENDTREQKRLSAFEYDAKGNLTRANRKAVDVGLMDEPTRSEGTPLYYDGLGRVTNLREPTGKVACSWAPDGTLVEALAARHRCRYAYDPLGRRIRKTVGAAHTDYGWMGHRLLWEECHGGPDGAAPYRRDYLWTPDGVQPLAFRQDGRTFWLVCDARGAVIRALDEDGRIAWLATYDSFGVATTHIAKVQQPFRLPGHYHDEESGLHYCFARYYSPTLRTYLTPDPARLVLGASRYGYCGNDPWNRMAPCGTGMLHLADGVVPLGPLVRAVLTRLLARATLGDTVTGPVTRVAGVLASAPRAPNRLPMRALAEGIDRSVVRAIGACLLQRARGGDPVVATAGGPPLGPAAMLDLAILRLGRIPPMRHIERVEG
jgi:RHS repeat-associated protein